MENLILCPVLTQDVLNQNITPKQILHILAITLAQVKSINTSKNLLKNI